LNKDWTRFVQNCNFIFLRNSVGRNIAEVRHKS
jgi:hypothetical protein